MSLNNIYMIASSILAVWGLLLTIFLLLNSSLKRVFYQTNRLLENMDINQIPIRKTSHVYLLLLKRAFDICFSILALVWVLPMLVLIGVLIKMDSKGPIFFTQSRLGLHGRKFGYFKFRTMVIDKPADKQYESADKQFLSFDDYRITKFGRFLRKTALDEIPALINVIKGDISIVGRSRILDYPKVAVNVKPEIKAALLDIKPGIVSLWAVSHDRIKSNPDHLLFYDLVYLNRMSFVFDLMIILRSIVVSLGTTAGY